MPGQQTLQQQERVDDSTRRVNGPTRARATVSTSIDSSDLKKSEQVQTPRLFEIPQERMRISTNQAK